MGFWTALGGGVLAIIIFLWALFKDWLFIFISPIFNLEILWIIIPIWINGIFTEVFQEKKGTGLGNAVTNGAVMLWVGVDWVRYIIRQLSEGGRVFGWEVFFQFFLCAVVLGIGLFIILYGIKGKGYIKYIGRVRETTYLTLVISPVIYGIITLSWQLLLAVLIFFPLFYYLIEFADRFTPNPATYDDVGPNDQLGNTNSPGSGEFKF